MDDEIVGKVAPEDLGQMMVSDAIVAELSVNGIKVNDDVRRHLLAQLEAGELTTLAFDAIVFLDGPNANDYRFWEKDLPRFADSYADKPFLRNHDRRDIGARDGTIRTSVLDGKAFVQKIALTTQRGIRSLAEEQIDRFSIGWDFDAITCGICGEDYMLCPHFVGRRYAEEEGAAPQVCEIWFENPVGAETSAVNSPAVDGTRILAQLNALKTDNLKQQKQQEVVMDEKEKKAAEGTPAVEPVLEQVKEPVPKVEQEDEKDWGAYFRGLSTDAALTGSGLPPVMQEGIRQELDGRDYGPTELQAAIDRRRAELAKLQEDQVIKGHGTPVDAGVTGMLTSVDRITEALTSLIMGERPKQGVRPLSGIREAYVLLSGDYDMKGMFVPENVGLAAVDTTTMAGIVANALNKVVVNQFQQYPMDWLRVCTIKNFTTLQQIRWITLGGVGELPTVSEGAAYTEMTWDDQTETDDWLKKGGYLGITLEAIDRDDVGRIQQAAPAIAQAAYLTLSKAFAAIFTAQTGTGPNMSDGVALFHTATHGNLLTTALSPAAWRAVKIAMMKQTELNSGERLGALTYPYYALVPIDLVDPMVEILATENVASTMDFRINPDAQGEGREERLRRARDRIIQVDFWTEIDHWAAAADPRKYPSIGLGYRFGPTPEIFSVASENSGLMFSNDVMPIKCRFFYAIGPMDWRGLHKSNV